MQYICVYIYIYNCSNNLYLCLYFNNTLSSIYYMHSKMVNKSSSMKTMIEVDREHY